MQERGTAIFWPPNPAPHLTDWLLEIGPTTSGSMGEAAIGWQDLTAWERITGIELEPFEAKTIRRLSQVFISARYEAKKPDCPIPYAGLREEIISQRENVAKRIKGAFGGLVGKRG